MNAVSVGRRTHLNNAGASLPTEATIAVQVAHLALEAELGPMAAAQEVRSDVEDFYRIVASTIGAASESEIAYVDSASRAWDSVLYGLQLNRDDEIITLSTEFGTNLVSLYHLAERTGVKIKVIECAPDGTVSPDDVKAALSPSTRAIALSHVAAHGAIVNPVEEIGAIARERSLFFLVDGCHAVGQLPVDVGKIGCDAYTSTGRKWLRGPRGTGFLYVSNSQKEARTPFVDLASADLVLNDRGQPIGVDIRSDARQFELWERSLVALLGLRNALIEYREFGVGKAKLIPELASLLAQQVLRQVPTARIVGPPHLEVGIVGFIFEEEVLERVKRALTDGGITHSVMSDWDAPIHFKQLRTEHVLRLSPHYYNDVEEVNLASGCVIEAAR